MRKLVFLFTFIYSTFSLAQISSSSDISDLVKSARDQGYSNMEIIQLAASMGYSSEEILALQSQIGETDPEQEEINARSREPFQVEQKDPAKYLKSSAEVYGMSLFSSGSVLTFNPDPNTPTPANYVLDAGDELAVDIYGVSDKYYTSIVSPDGYLTLSQIGPIRLSGLTVSEAKKAITSRLSRVYDGLRGANPTTFVNVGLVNARAITVHVVGDVKVPGSYTLNGFSSVFNSLYAASGVLETGTFRDVVVNREGKKIASSDLYDLLNKGEVSNNLRLQSGDVVFVGPYKSRVVIEGAIKRAGAYEMLPGETVEDLLRFCAGFSGDALSNRLQLERVSKDGIVISEVFESQFEIFELRDGDKIRVFDVTENFKNRVSIDGAIEYPGNYALQEDLTIDSLISLAGGVRPDASIKKIIIERTLPDYSIEQIHVDLSIDKAVALKKEDRIYVPSINDLVELPYVVMTGEVVKPGVHRFAQNFSLTELVIASSGLKNSAFGGTIEISRRAEDQKATKQREIFIVDIPEDISDLSSMDDVVVQPFDHITVRKNPDFHETSTITVTGEIANPGNFTVISRNERISDMLQRAGNLTPWAHQEGAILIRKTEFFEGQNESVAKNIELAKILATMDTTTSEVDKYLYDQIVMQMANNSLSASQTNESVASSAKQERLSEIKKRNPLLTDLNVKESEAIALDLGKILSSPGGEEDFIVEDGDIIVIPKQLSTVRLRGHVLYPSTVQYSGQGSARSYINQAGGFDVRAKRGYTYVIQANGEVNRTKRFLFFKSYPGVEPGAEIIVPVKPPKIPIRPAEIASLTTGVAALMAVVVNLIRG